MTTRIILFSLLFMSFSLASMAQRDGSKRERMQALKVAFITEELQLTSQQAKQFWPIYEQLESELKALRQQAERRPDFSKASDKEIETWIFKKMDIDDQQTALKRKYLKRFEQVISWQQIAKLLHAEKRFKKELLERIRERRGEREQGRRE